MNAPWHGLIELTTLKTLQMPLDECCLSIVPVIGSPSYLDDLSFVVVLQPRMLA